MIFIGSLADRFFDTGVDAKIQGSYLGFCHGGIGIRCNANVTQFALNYQTTRFARNWPDTSVTERDLAGEARHMSWPVIPRNATPPAQALAGTAEARL